MTKSRMLSVLAICGLTLSSGSARAQVKPDDAITKIEAVFEPAVAKPGQTVTLKVTMVLADGLHTYPVEQVDKAAKSQTNRFTFPEAGTVIFVDKVSDPLDYKTKAETVLDIEELRYLPKGGIWERKAVVAPTATAGTTETEVKFRVLVCNKDNCFPPKMLVLKAKLTVEGAAVAVEAKYADEVKKATGK